MAELVKPRRLNTEVAGSNPTMHLFTSRSTRSAQTAGTKIAVHFPHLFVCLFVCASALITCAIYYVIRYYATAVQLLKVCRPSYSK